MTPPLDRYPVVSLLGIGKRYPGVQALADVELEVLPNEVHGLVGENGAGKSTLIKIIGGVEAPDTGTYHLAGKSVSLTSARAARSAGISVLHQERSIVPTFSVGENVLLDEIVSKPFRKFYNKSEIAARAKEYLAILGLDVDPAGSVTGLSAAQLQLLEIARALSVDARLLVLDEPTASIALHEASKLLATIRGLRDQGVSVLYVTHKLEEVFEICDRVSVLRDGRRVGDTVSINAISREALITRMVGREVSDKLPSRTVNNKEIVLEARSLRQVGGRAAASFTLRRGEILGWYGLVGSGRTELAHLIIGARHAEAGELILNNKPIRLRSVARALRKYHIGYVSEDRQGEGLFLMHSVAKNISAATWRSLRRRTGLMDIARERARAEQFKAQLDIRTPTVTQVVANLSGGNKQKVSLAKWLAAVPELLIIDEPTVGIDIRTKYEVHSLIASLANEGMSIIVISSDLVEVVRLVDRILVFRDGQIVAEHENNHDYDGMSRQVMADVL